MKEFTMNIICLVGAMALTWALLTVVTELAYYIK